MVLAINLSSQFKIEPAFLRVTRTLVCISGLGQQKFHKLNSTWMFVLIIPDPLSCLLWEYFPYFLNSEYKNFLKISSFSTILPWVAGILILSNTSEC